MTENGAVTQEKKPRGGKRAKEGEGFNLCVGKAQRCSGAQVQPESYRKGWKLKVGLGENRVWRESELFG